MPLRTSCMDIFVSVALNWLQNCFENEGNWTLTASEEGQIKKKKFPENFKNKKKKFRENSKIFEIFGKLFF